MNRRRIILAVVAVAALFLVWKAWGPGSTDANVLPGYLEGETLFMAAPGSGKVNSVTVVRGQRVEAGAALFTMDSAVLTAQAQAAAAQLAQARAQVEVSKAKARQARANAAAMTAHTDKAGADLARFLGVQRIDKGAVAQEQIDTARTSVANAVAQRDASESDARAQDLQVTATESQVAQYQAALEDVRARLDQLSPHAPASGRVQEVFFQQGEWASANQPIVSLLPDQKLKVRFFVPQKDLTLYQPGQTVKFTCDGCAADLAARISYVSPNPEFTPPMIYTRKSRDRMVFLVEALPTDPRALSPGLPVEVLPLPREAHAKETGR